MHRSRTSDYDLPLVGLGPRQLLLWNVAYCSWCTICVSTDILLSSLALHDLRLLIIHSNPRVPALAPRNLVPLQFTILYCL